VNPDEAQTGDIVVELMHNEFRTKAQVWVKMQDGTNEWATIARFQKRYNFTSNLA
jgi:hypothetical protein